MALITKEKVIGGLLLLLSILKPIATKAYKKWVDDSPTVEDLLIKATFGWYRKKARAKRAKDNVDLARRVNNDEVGDKICSLLQTLCDVFHFQRATVSDYTYLGDKFPDQPVESDFYKINLTITHEYAVDSIKRVKEEWNNRDARGFAKALWMLHYSEKGWINIGPKDSYDLTSEQNMYNVTKCYRFKLGQGLFNGVLVLSCLFFDTEPDLTDEQIDRVKIIARRIYLEKLKYIP